MEELTLHFEAGAGTDVAAAAAALQKELQGVSGVESAQTEAQTFQSIGPAEVMSIIQVGTQVMQTSAAFLAAAAALYAAWQKVKPMFPALQPPKLEVGLKQIPVDQLSEVHRTELTS